MVTYTDFKETLRHVEKGTDIGSWTIDKINHYGHITPLKFYLMSNIYNGPLYYVLSILLADFLNNESIINFPFGIFKKYLSTNSESLIEAWDKYPLYAILAFFLFELIGGLLPFFLLYYRMFFVFYYALPYRERGKTIFRKFRNTFLYEMGAYRYKIGRASIKFILIWLAVWFPCRIIRIVFQEYLIFQKILAYIIVATLVGTLGVVFARLMGVIIANKIKIPIRVYKSTLGYGKSFNLGKFRYVMLRKDQPNFGMFFLLDNIPIGLFFIFYWLLL